MFANNLDNENTCPDLPIIYINYVELNRMRRIVDLGKHATRVIRSIFFLV